MRPGPIVLASGSRYRAELLASVAGEVTVDPPEVDERALDALFAEVGPEAFALELARRKAAVVATRHPGSLVVAGDQVGVLGSGADAVQLTKQPDADAAVRQLLSMSATTHRLVNALVVVRAGTDVRAEGIDVVRVTMREIDEREARAYVERFEPFDTAGSYRLEDGARMAPSAPFVVRVEGEHDSGVVGLPLPLLGRLLDAADPSRAQAAPPDPSAPSVPSDGTTSTSSTARTSSSDAPRRSS